MPITQSTAEPTCDLSYKQDSLFTTFLPNTKAGEEAWKVMAESEGGVAKVLNIHAESVIAQLRKAGYSVHKDRGGKVKMSAAELDELVAALS